MRFWKTSSRIQLKSINVVPAHHEIGAKSTKATVRVPMHAYKSTFTPPAKLRIFFGLHNEKPNYFALP
jgi:hypothetical protein